MDGGAVTRPVGRIGSEETPLVNDIARRQLNAHHGPVKALPGARKVIGSVTVHDLAFLRHPEHCLPFDELGWSPRFDTSSARWQGCG
jgi:hypothetical protein